MKKILLCLLICFGYNAPLASAQTIEQAEHLVSVWLEAQRDYNDWPSVSVSFVDDQKMIYAKSFGYANPHTKLEATPDTLYRIASNSKLFTSLAIMQLRDAGKLDLREPVQKYIPWLTIKQKYPLSDVISIESLLTHSSGLPYEPNLGYWSYRDGYPFPDLEELKKGTANLETLYRAWEHYQYSNLGFILLGQVVENASGMSYEKYVHDHIIKPMGLNNTYTNVDPKKHGKDLAIGYGALDRKRERMEVPFIDAKATTSAAGVSSSANDLAKFLMWQIRTYNGAGDKVLNQNSLREMMRPHAVHAAENMDVGYGFRTIYRNGISYIGHGGVYAGHTSQTMIEPNQKIGAVALMNTHSSTPPLQIVNNMMDILGSVLKANNPKPAEDFSEYEGSYDQQPWADELYIMQWGDELISFSLKSGHPLDSITRYRHLERDNFIALRDDGGEADVTTFLRDDNGKVIKLTNQSDYLTRK
ncbi:MAG: serine hydrolase domain-containing protein [Emcibacteraceae bacterium]